MAEPGRGCRRASAETIIQTFSWLGSRLLVPVNYYLSPFLFTTTVGDSSKVSLNWQVSDPTPVRQTWRHHCESVTAEMGGTNIPQQDWDTQPTPKMENKAGGGGGEGSLCLFYSIFLATKFSPSLLFENDPWFRMGLCSSCLIPQVGIFWNKILSLDGLPCEEQISSGTLPSTGCIHASNSKIDQIVCSNNLPLIE